MKIYDLKTPALLIDKDVLEQNIFRIQEKAKSWKVRLRPHIKTHKCYKIAKLQEEAGAKGITVSTFPEAKIFAENGFTDITWAFPFQPDYVKDAIELSKKIDFGILLDSKESLELLERECSKSSEKMNVWLEIDTGQHRSGVCPSSKLSIELARKLAGSRFVNFKGILTHAGHAYLAHSKIEIKRIANSEKEIMIEFKNKIKDFSDPIISIGSTPTVAVTEDLKDIDEIRPGNYVFNDYTQVLLGCCKVKNCALLVLATVVSKNSFNNTIVLDAGALALSKDPGPKQINNYNSYGMIFKDLITIELEKNIGINYITQEHCVVTVNEETKFKKFKYGDKVKILVNHSCLTAALFDYYNVISGEDVIDRWKINRARNLSY